MSDLKFEEKENIIAKLTMDKIILLGATQKAYEKHHLGDDSIGWEELGDLLGRALAEVMGDGWFQTYLNNRGRE